MKKSFGLKTQDYLNYPQKRTLRNIISILLLPVSILYAFLMIVRRQFYEMGVFRSKRLNHPVISVGNLTTGGTGKTPFEIYLIEMMKDMGTTALLLSRGYGSKSSSENAIMGQESDDSVSLPDEVGMIAARIPDIPIAFGKNRYKAYKMAEKNYDFDVVILDDGFQHLRIKRGLDILILDAARPFGSGRCLPSGNLREPKSMQRYADFAVLNQKSGSEMPNGWQGLTGSYSVTETKNIKSDAIDRLSEFSGKKCGIITAIGDAESFKGILERQKIKIAGIYRFRDHHSFTKDDLEVVREMCLANQIDCLFTTEKDAVKLKKICFENPPVYVIKIAFRLENGENVLKQRIESLVRK